MDDRIAQEAGVRGRLDEWVLSHPLLPFPGGLSKERKRRTGRSRTDQEFGYTQFLRALERSQTSKGARGGLSLVALHCGLSRDFNFAAQRGQRQR